MFEDFKSEIKTFLIAYPACEGFSFIGEPPCKETLDQILSTFRFVE